jgi:hypothetical protein
MNGGDRPKIAEVLVRAGDASDSAMNDNEGTVLQQIAHLEAIAITMREDLKEARTGHQLAAIEYAGETLTPL